ncbi:MAG: tetraacyldisaccharide 4'-kinase [Alteromonadaceae bacterium]|nr:MAG: tetraacyldisaccharide 4'-kinase [Alteromonadaceae bacterium]
MSIKAFIEQRWYGRVGILYLLTPLSWCFAAIAARRKRRLQAEAILAPVQTLVVGNIAVGGTGKTPVIIALVKFLQAKGLRPGVVSRGYGRQDTQLQFLPAYIDTHPSTEIHSDATAGLVGDEPLLIYTATACDVAVAADRVAAVACLVEHGCDVIIADDGLQHYRMGRHFELAVIDGVRVFGNGHLLPVGPLRELPERLRDVDWVLVNQSQQQDTDIQARKLAQIHAYVQNQTQEASCFNVALTVTGLSRVDGRGGLDGDETRMSLTQLADLSGVVALAGIGDPEKFFETLAGFTKLQERRIFPDHHQYCAEDFANIGDKPVVMTSKDAVKCRTFAKPNWYALEVAMQLPEAFLAGVERSLIAQTKTAQASPNK